jgi:hypothetical protein
VQFEQSDTLQPQPQANALRLVERKKLHDLAGAELLQRTDRDDQKRQV